MTEGVAWLHYWKTLTFEPENGEHKPPKQPLIVFETCTHVSLLLKTLVLGSAYLILNV